MGYIYSITNKINGKKYIGQTNNYKKRWWEHKNSFNKEHRKDYSSRKNAAFRKYGVENFLFEVLEEVEDSKMDERELYYIEFFDSFNNGYNSTPGPCAPLRKIREEHSMAVLTEKQIPEIHKLLKEGNLSYNEIGDIYGVTGSTIGAISNGVNWYDESIDYPIRKEPFVRRGSKSPTSRFTEEQVMEIRKLYSTMTVPQLVEKYSHLASESAIRKVISGESYSHLPVYRKKKNCWTLGETCIDYPLG